VLADAEAKGHNPHHLLTEAAARRELVTARQPARVLITRIQHTSRNPVPNRRAEAARLRSQGVPAPSSTTAVVPIPSAAVAPDRARPRR
jgi:hypothetical protein